MTTTGELITTEVTEVDRHRQAILDMCYGIAFHLKTSEKEAIKCPDDVGRSLFKAIATEYRNLVYLLHATKDGTYASSAATKSSVRCRELLRSEWYQRLFPAVFVAPDEDTKQLFKLTGGGSRRAVPIGGTVTGLHPDMVVIDDPNERSRDQDLYFGIAIPSKTVRARLLDHGTGREAHRD